ncbi:hypothetical protein OHB12_23205 [Nocardia sp. NBC_01730]|uniref:hypothetical protein n=1 Tax=Nocardia sp. NBC_01730 TaxID=2975998 RepID=UPI002E13B985|nr:hypothetical protein OHB12_23205 [Nocardia sp. NBC_01730]
MTVLTTVLILAFSGFLIYHFAPRRDERAFRLERFHPRTPMSDQTCSYYDVQRRYSDLAAIYGRGDILDKDLPGIAEADRAVGVRPVPAPITSARPTRKTGVPAGGQCGGSTRKATSPLLVNCDETEPEPLTAGSPAGASKTSFG